MRSILGWLVVLVFSLISFCAGIAVLVAMDDPSQTVITGTCVGIIGGIALGMWLRDRIIRRPK